MHLQHPFHRVQKWGGRFFVRSSLHEVGIKLELGHAGRRCPYHISGETLMEMEKEGEDDDDDDDDQGAEAEREEYTLRTESSPFRGTGRNGSMLTVVDMTGIHHLDVNWCGCENCPPRDQQLLAMGLYPASTLQPQTAFTFRVLDDYLLTNKECKTSAMSYYSRLRRVTDNAFPQRVPVRKSNNTSILGGDDNWITG